MVDIIVVKSIQVCDGSQKWSRNLSEWMEVSEIDDPAQHQEESKYASGIELCNGCHSSTIPRRSSGKGA